MCVATIVTRHLLYQLVDLDLERIPLLVRVARDQELTAEVNHLLFPECFVEQMQPAC